MSEWLELDPQDYEDAVEVWGIITGGRPQFVLTRRESEWDFCAVLHLDTDGVGGLEHIDSYPTLAAAQTAAEPTVREFLSNSR